MSASAFDATRLYVPGDGPSAKGPSAKGAGANGASAGWALGVAAVCLAGLAATWVVAALVPITHARDATTLYEFTRLSRPRVDLLANHLLDLLEPGLYTVWGLILVGIALLRRRPRLALVIAVVLPLAPFSAEVLKPLLAHPHAYSGLKDITAASWPSGHATAATVLALCAVMAVPYALRPLVAALGTVFVFGVSCSLLILAWHMPSDVVGGYLLAGLWVSLAVAFLRASGPRGRSADSRGRELRRSSRTRSGVRPVRAGLPQ
jgi:membrane-associated phospholipid phosphatase